MRASLEASGFWGLGFFGVSRLWVLGFGVPGFWGFGFGLTGFGVLEFRA